MQDETRDAPEDGYEEVPPPTGTLFVMMLYMMVLAGMWGAIYLIYLER